MQGEQLKKAIESARHTLALLERMQGAEEADAFDAEGASHEEVKEKWEALFSGLALDYGCVTQLACSAQSAWSCSIYDPCMSGGITKAHAIKEEAIRQAVAKWKAKRATMSNAPVQELRYGRENW